MIRVTCKCGKSIEVPDQFAGKTGKCKACGTAVLVPFVSEPEPVFAALAGDDDVVEMTDNDIVTPFTAPVSPPSAPIVTNVDDSNAELKTFSKPRAKEPYNPIGKEPWYFRFLVGYAYAIVGIGALGAVFYVVLGVLVAGRTAGSMVLVAVLGSAARGIGIVLISLVVAAPILLGVNIARGVRLLCIQGAVAAQRM